MKSHRPFLLAWICLAVSLLFTGGLNGQVVTTSSSTRPISEQFRWMPVPATLSSPGKPGDFASDGTDLYIYTGTGRPPHSWIVAGSGGGSGTVTSVNGNTGAVTVQPQPTIAALASTALVLSQDNVIRTKDVTGTLNLTAADLGSAGDYLKLNFTIAGTQLFTTDFPVYRNGASASENISQSYTDTAAILLLNMGGGVIQWRDEKFVDLDLPVTTTATAYTPTSATLKGHLEGINTTLAGISTAALAPGTYFGWTTSDLANKPANSLVADGTNGTVNAGTFASGAGTWLAMGGGTVSTPTADVAAGTYSSTQNVTLSSLTSGASIYYTTNGATPTTSDTLYSSPVAIAATSTLKAKAFKSLYAASAVMSESYTISTETTPTQGNLLGTEGFETATTGYMRSGWVGAYGSPDPYYDITGLTTNKPYGAVSHGFRVNYAANGTKHYKVWYSGSGRTTRAYSRAYVYIESESIGNSESISLMGFVNNAADAGLGVHNATITLGKSAGGQLQLSAGGATNSTPVSISTGQWYLVEMSMLPNGASGFKVNGGSEQTFTASGYTQWQSFAIGNYSLSTTAYTGCIYDVDLVAVDSTGYIGATP